jgi:hypothetical protein
MKIVQFVLMMMMMMMMKKLILISVDNLIKKIFLKKIQQIIIILNQLFVQQTCPQVKYFLQYLINTIQTLADVFKKHYIPDFDLYKTK